MDNMDNEKKGTGGLVGALIVIIVVAAVLIYLIPKKSEIQIQNPAPIGESLVPPPTNTFGNTNAEPNTTQSTDTPDSIESDLNSFDSSGSDINFDGSEI